MSAENAENEPAATQPGEPAPARPRSQLFRKYAHLIAVLVSSVLTAGGLVEIYFSYQETKSALFQIQRGKAAGIVLSFLAGLLLACRIVRPIQALQQGAGSGGVVSSSRSGASARSPDSARARSGYGSCPASTPGRRMNVASPALYRSAPSAT